jgi:L-amino acid N-acyltransferase YncA
LKAQARSVRVATRDDLERIREIYNEGIEDREATLDVEPKSRAAIDAWFAEHDERYAVIVAEDADAIVGWASLNRYSYRYTYEGVGDLSIYVARPFRGKGVGSELLEALERHARDRRFHKIVLFTLPSNAAGQALYRKLGYREVGVFKEQGAREGRRFDVVAMEKILV